MKGKHNDTKQTVHLKLKDVILFKTNTLGNLVCLPKNAPINLLMPADSTTFIWITKTMGAGNHFSHLSFTANAYHDVTTTCIEEDYNTSCAVVA